MASLELDSLQKAVTIVDQVSEKWTSKSKASLVTVVYKMLSEGEAKSNMTLTQLRKVHKLKDVA